ncbi:V-set domain-containing T-cell activation inhibitor 1 [Electrophorus electricus]|uniref:V-set domain-containing T-cell activation inhibitor 1 n=1 Tax=Electrophorus electricus TaxID=8005 RepID=UPI0015D0B538|nr:V-set domain-containing T-cell activation inhibitor 1 [Electrophorus electricus]
MASFGQIIFWSMIVLIFVIAALLILLLAIAFSVSQGIVETKNGFPVGNLGQDVVLDCTFQSNTGKGPAGNVLITWTKERLSGVVYQYQNNAPQLKDQNSQFQNRAQLFPDVIATGNASLLLRRVTMEDDGVYRCVVSAPGVSGTVRIHLSVGAFSAPAITTANKSLRAEAPRWLPRPSVTWLDPDGERLAGVTQFNNSSDGTVQVVSSLQHPVAPNETYTCIIQNHLVQAVSEATVTGEGVSAHTSFLFSSSPRTLPVPPHCAATILLCMLVW